MRSTLPAGHQLDLRERIEGCRKTSTGARTTFCVTSGLFAFAQCQISNRANPSRHQPARIALYAGPEKVPATEKTGLALAADDGDRQALDYNLALADLKLPADLAQRALPAQAAPVDGAGLLKAAQLPTRKDKRWHIELAPLSRMA